MSVTISQKINKKHKKIKEHKKHVFFHFYKKHKKRFLHLWFIVIIFSLNVHMLFVDSMWVGESLGIPTTYG